MVMGVMGKSHRCSSGPNATKPLLSRGFEGADDGIRTRDPHLGKVMLYQLSHVRVATTETTRTASSSKPRSAPGQV